MPMQPTSSAPVKTHQTSVRSSGRTWSERASPSTTATALALSLAPATSWLRSSSQAWRSVFARKAALSHCASRAGHRRPPCCMNWAMPLSSTVVSHPVVNWSIKWRTLGCWSVRCLALSTWAISTTVCCAGRRGGIRAMRFALVCRGSRISSGSRCPPKRRHRLNAANRVRLPPTIRPLCPVRLIRLPASAISSGVVTAVAIVVRVGNGWYSIPVTPP
jgi:hypothetical protein